MFSLSLATIVDLWSRCMMLATNADIWRWFLYADRLSFCDDVATSRIVERYTVSQKLLRNYFCITPSILERFSSSFHCCDQKWLARNIGWLQLFLFFSLSLCVCVLYLCCMFVFVMLCVFAIVLLLYNCYTDCVKINCILCNNSPSGGAVPVRARSSYLSEKLM